MEPIGEWHQKCEPFAYQISTPHMNEDIDALSVHWRMVWQTRNASTILWNKMLKNWTSIYAYTQANKGPFLQFSCSMCFSREKQNAFQTLHAPCFVNYLSTFWIWFQRPRHFIENTVIAVFITVAIGVTVGHPVGVTTVGYCGDKLCSWLTKRKVTVECYASQGSALVFCFQASCCFCVGRALCWV